MIFEQSLNRKSSIRTSNLRLFFLMILLTSPIATFANDIAEGKTNHQEIDWLKNVILKQNDRLTFLEKQNNQRDEENRLLITQVSNHRIEIDQINKVLMKANLINRDIEQPLSNIGTNSIVKRPARLLPANILRPSIKPRGMTYYDEKYGIPTSCSHLNILGHTLNGIYLIKKTDYSKIEAVFCNFQPFDGSFDPLEKRFGYVDVKTGASGIYFHVHMNGFRFSNSKMRGSVINYFDAQLLNTGNGMNLTSGVFTAPKPGVYHFSVVFVKSDGGSVLVNPDPLHISIRLNGKNIAETFVKSGLVSSIASVQATLRLKTGDRIDLYKHSGELATHSRGHSFTGWLIEEDLLE